MIRRFFSIKFKTFVRLNLFPKKYVHCLIFEQNFKSFLPFGFGEILYIVHK